MGSEGEEEEDAPEQRRFRDGVDLHLGAIEQTNARKRETHRKAPTQINIKMIETKLVRMHEKCMNM